VTSRARWTICIAVGLSTAYPVAAQQRAGSWQRPDVVPLRPQGIEQELRAPSGDQFIVGWMGSVLLGFIAWRAFDEPAGQHSRVKQGWGYTPRAMTALAIGSHAGASLGIWGKGRLNGSRGSLLLTSAAVAVPTVPVILGRNDPLLPLMTVVAWAPLQAFAGYAAYKYSSPVRARRGGDLTPVERRPPRGPRGDAVISAEELALNPGRSVYDVVVSLRPHWLTEGRLRSPTEREGGGEAGTLLVYVDGTRHGNLESLRQLMTSDVREVWYLNARDATSRYGTGHTAGVIEVRRAGSS